MAQHKEPRPRSQELQVVLTALPPTCARATPLWTPVFEVLACSAEHECQKSFKSFLTDQPSHLWQGIPFICQRTVGSRTHRFCHVGILLRQLLSRGSCSCHVPLRALQNFHRKGLRAHTHPGAYGNRQRVTF